MLESNCWKTVLYFYHLCISCCVSILMKSSRFKIWTQKRYDKSHITVGFKQFNSHLKTSLMYSCSVRKYGTLLYWPQVDLRPALAQALWRSQNIGTQSTNENYTSSSTKLYNLTSDTELLRELNTQIHSQIKEFLSKDAVAVVNHDQIDVNHLIDEIPPKLWQAVTLLTESVSERRGTSTVSKTDSASYHIKRIRLFF